MTDPRKQGNPPDAGSTQASDAGNPRTGNGSSATPDLPAQEQVASPQAPAPAPITAPADHQVDADTAGQPIGASAPGAAASAGIRAARPIAQIPPVVTASEPKAEQVAEAGEGATATQGECGMQRAVSSFCQFVGRLRSPVPPGATAGEPVSDTSGRKHISHYIGLISSALSKNWEEGEKPIVADELSKMLVLLPRLLEMPKFDRWAYVDLIFSCLNKESGTHGIVVARSLRKDLERYRRRESYWYSRVLSWLAPDVPVANLLAGLISSLFLVIGVSSIINHYMATLAGQDVNGFIYNLAESGAIRLVTISAFLGCIVSIFSSLQKYSDIIDPDPFLLFVTTTMKPLVSAIIAMIIVLILASKIIAVAGIDFSFADPKKISDNEAIFLILIGFFSGFSERFAMSVIQRADDKLTQAPGAPSTGKSG